MTLNLHQGWLHVGTAQGGTELFSYLQKTTVDDVAFSPSSEFLCATGEGTTIYRLEDGAAIHRYPEARSISQGTEDGTFLMSYSKGLVQIDAESGSVQHQVLPPQEMRHPGHNLFGGWNQGGLDMSLSPDHTTLFVGGGYFENRHSLVHLPTGEWRTIDFHNRVTDIAWLPDSSGMLITGSESQHAYSGSIAQFQRDGTQLAHVRQTGGDTGGPAITVTASPDGKRILYATRMSSWIGGESFPQAFVANADSLHPLREFSWQIFSIKNLQWARYLDEETLLCITGNWQYPALGLVQEQNLKQTQRLTDLKGTHAVLSPQKDYVAVGEGSQIRVFRLHKTP